MNEAAIIRGLRDENDRLHEENRQLRAVLGETIFVPPEWKLTASEEVLFKLLLSRDIVTREMAAMMLYSDRPGDVPVEKIHDIFIHKIRTKLRRHEISIKTIWGRGWYMEKPDKDRFYKLRAEARAHG